MPIAFGQIWSVRCSFLVLGGMREGSSMASFLARRLQLNGWPQPCLGHYIITTDWNKTHILLSFPPEGISMSPGRTAHLSHQNKTSSTGFSFKAYKFVGIVATTLSGITRNNVAIETFPKTKSLTSFSSAQSMHLVEKPSSAGV